MLKNVGIGLFLIGFCFLGGGCQSSQLGGGRPIGCSAVEESSSPAVKEENVACSKRGHPEEVLSSSLIQLLPSEEADRLDPDLTSDGKLLAFASNQFTATYNIYVYDQIKKETVEITHNAFENRFPKFSPDGQSLLYLSNASGSYALFWVSLSDLKAPRQLIHRQSDPMLTADWNPHGKVIAYSLYDALEKRWEIWLYHLSTGLSSPLTEGVYPCWSPDGTQLAFQRPNGTGSSSYELWVYDFSKRSYAHVITLNHQPSLQPTWSPDGAFLLFIQVEETGGQSSEYSLEAFRLAARQGVSLLKTSDPLLTPVWVLPHQILFSLRRGNHYNVYGIKPLLR